MHGHAHADFVSVFMWVCAWEWESPLSFFSLLHSIFCLSWSERSAAHLWKRAETVAGARGNPKHHRTAGVAPPGRTAERAAYRLELGWKGVI